MNPDVSPVTIGRSSDYYGPNGNNSSLAQLAPTADFFALRRRLPVLGAEFTVASASVTRAS